MHPNFQKQGLRSHLRLELILNALAAELDADSLRSQLNVQATLLSGVAMDAQKVGEIMEQVTQDIVRSHRSRECDFSDQIQAVRKAATVDELFKLYQAMMDAKVIPKAHG